MALDIKKNKVLCMLKKDWVIFFLILFTSGCVLYFFAFSPETVSITPEHRAKISEELNVELKTEIDKYIEFQWAEYGDSWVPRHEQLAPEKRSECIIFYVHGYMGPIKGTPWYSHYAFCPLESSLRNFRYVVCNPGLDGRKKYMSFAQGFDAYQVEKHLERLVFECSKKNIQVPIICIGHSNGASTLISVLCNNHKLSSQVSGIILLAPYADLAEAVVCQKVPSFLGGRAIACKAIKLLLASKYNLTIPSPVQRVEKGMYPLNVPTLLAHSKADLLLPYNNFEMLKTAFEIKNKNVQFLSLTKDSHSLRRISCELRQGVTEFVTAILRKK